MNRKVESILTVNLIIFVVLTVLGIVLFYSSSVGTFLLFVGTLYLSLIPSAAVHEIGHALAVLLLGMRLFTVTFGGAADRILSIRRFVGYDFVFRRNLLGGKVNFGPKSLRLARLRRFLVVLAGPMATGLLIVVAVTLCDRSSRQGMIFCVAQQLPMRECCDTCSQFVSPEVSQQK